MLIPYELNYELQNRQLVFPKDLARLTLGLFCGLHVILHCSSCAVNNVKLPVPLYPSVICTVCTLYTRQTYARIIIVLVLVHTVQYNGPYAPEVSRFLAPSILERAKQGESSCTTS